MWFLLLDGLEDVIWVGNHSTYSFLTAMASSRDISDKRLLITLS